jgi:hypothetical protein
MPTSQEQKLDRQTTTSISSLELKQLFIQLINISDVCVRYRQLGELWMRNFTRVISVSEKNGLVYDELDQKYYLVRFNNVMQFEIDSRFQNFQPYFHYSVEPSRELD